MKKTLYLVITLFSLFSAELNGQHTTVVCGFDHFIKMKKLHDPNYYEGYKRLFENCKTKEGNRGGGVYTLPVVFHIVYNSADQQIADSVVYSQMEVLNEDYRRLNADAVNTRDIFLPVAADCEINFVLASVDPAGNPTTGITHNYTPRTEFELDLFASNNTLDEVKHNITDGVDAWDPSHYINIWVCNITTNFAGAQIFGMSYPPAGLDNWPTGSSPEDLSDEGIIVHYTTVGRNNPFEAADNVSDNNLGRTLTHEMGHYLGLRHTWGDELFTGICSEDDGIDDTPLCGSGDQYLCDYTANTCDDGTATDQPDMLENYMDYTTDACFNMFTQGQKSLMRFVIEELRNTLLENVGVPENQKTSINFPIWPNPTEQTLHIQLPTIGETYTYEIQNNLGLTVLSGTIRSNQIDISKLSAGSYLLRVSQTNKTAVMRFIRQ
jgi:hypothetical protein